MVKELKHHVENDAESEDKRGFADVAHKRGGAAVLDRFIRRQPQHYTLEGVCTSSSDKMCTRIKC